MIVLRRTRTALGLILCLASPAVADGPPVTSGLRILLSAVPQLEETPEGSYQIDFGDVRAAGAMLEASGNAPLDPEERAHLALLRGRTHIFSRTVRAEAESFLQANGFGFGDVVANLQYSRSPVWLNLISLRLGAGEGVAEVLPRVGFTQEDRHAQTVFWRGEEENAQLSRDLPADDIYGGQLLRSTRLALSGDMLAYTSNWPQLDAVLTGDLPRLTDDADIAALLDAIDMAADPDERLIRAVLYFDALPAETAGNLLLADLFGDAGHVTLAAFLPSGVLPASDLAARLEANWNGLVIGDRRGSYAVVTGAAADVRVVEAGQPVVVMRLETAFNERSDNFVLTFNSSFDSVHIALMRRHFEPLLSDSP